METTFLMSKAISSALNRRKKIYLSHVVFELSDFEDGTTGKSQKIQFSKIQYFKHIFKQFFGSF